VTDHPVYTLCNCDWFMSAVDRMSVEAVTSVIVALVGLELQDLLDVLSVRYVAHVVCFSLTLFANAGGVRIRLDLLCLSYVPHTTSVSCFHFWRPVRVVCFCDQ